MGRAADRLGEGRTAARLDELTALLTVGVTTERLGLVTDGLALVERADGLVLSAALEVPRDDTVRTLRSLVTGRARRAVGGAGLVARVVAWLGTLTQFWPRESGRDRVTFTG